MPWTAADFKSKHWKDASDAQASKAARIANAILDGGGDEGVAIATGIKRAKETAAARFVTERELRAWGFPSVYDPDGSFQKIVKVVDHGGWIERHELIKGFPDAPAIVMKIGYTPSGDYIGSADDARHLVEKRGITPELKRADSGVCSVGKGKDGKWYGWSHRAIAPFDTRDEAVKFADEVAKLQIPRKKMTQKIAKPASLANRMKALSADDAVESGAVDEVHDSFKKADPKWKSLSSFARQTLRRYFVTAIGVRPMPALNLMEISTEGEYVYIFCVLKTGKEPLMLPYTKTGANFIMQIGRTMPARLRSAGIGDWEFDGFYARGKSATQIEVGIAFVKAGA